MNSAMNIVKFIGAWGCLVGAVIMLVITKDLGLAQLLSIMSIAFSVAPSGA